VDPIGPRLKTLRSHYGLSQRQLARKSGVSNATISLIEHGRTDPSMGLLKRILEAMGVSSADFFASENRPAEKYFLARDKLTVMSSGPISFRQVGGDRSADQLQRLHERYKPGAETGRSMLSHDAEEAGIILQGRLEVTVAEEVRVLSVGDADLFIHPPRDFRGVDALITNFHAPRPTLLCLVAPFLAPGSTEGVAWLRELYKDAVSRRYRFWFYGDAVFIL